MDISRHESSANFENRSVGVSQEPRERSHVHSHCRKSSGCSPTFVESCGPILRFRRLTISNQYRLRGCSLFILNRLNCRHGFDPRARSAVHLLEIPPVSTAMAARCRRARSASIPVQRALARRRSSGGLALHPICSDIRKYQIPKITLQCNTPAIHRSRAQSRNPRRAREAQFLRWPRTTLLRTDCAG